jgi:hypothetical protein
MSESNTQYGLSRVQGCWVHPFAKIKYAAATSALSVVAALTLQSEPAVAQEQAGTQSVEIFGGEQFGDNVTDAPVSGRTPRLNDNAVAGARYNYNFTDMWGIQCYRYLNGLVSDSNQHLNTAETTLGVGWRF